MSISVSSSGAKPLGLGGKIAGTLFFGVFLAMGLGFTVMIARSVAKNLTTYGWSQTDAVILSSAVEPPQSDRHDPTIRVLYAYTHGGTSYEAQRIDRDAVHLETQDAYRLAERYPAGAQVPCWVDPSNPGEAVLQRKSPLYALLTLFPLIFVAVGGGGIWALWWGRRKKSGPTIDAPLSSRAANRGMSRTVMALFFSVFLLVGCGVGYALFLRPLAQIVAAQNWTEVPCEIVSSRVRTHDGDDGSTYSVDVVYRYTYDERHYTSNRHHFFGGSSSGYESKAAVVSQYRPGTRARCYVDPASPADAVLERGPTAGLWFGLLPLAFILAGGFGLRHALRQKPAAAFTTSVTAAPVEGAQTLQPVVSRKAKLITLIAIALFWNGIVSVFLYQIAGSWSRGHGEWFPTLFLIPFVAVGLGLLGGVLHQFLALFNPRAQLTISRGAVSPGEAFEVSWNLGRVDRLRHIDIFLEGREEATYRRGTTTATDRSVFATLTVIATNDPVVMRSGSTRLHLPPGAMHSFASPNNKIVWALRVKGEIPHWPDIADEYPFTVIPRPLAS